AEKTPIAKSISLVVFGRSKRNGASPAEDDPIAKQFLVTEGCDDMAELPTMQSPFDDRLEDAKPSQAQLLHLHKCDGGKCAKHDFL
ncbi:hypothetical protein LSAT2_033007, partial [Lamellibrachia satsuma]